MYLNCKNVIYPHVADIVWKYLKEDEGNFDKIKKKLIENKKRFQFVYLSTYPEVYSFIEKRSIDLKNKFHLKFKDWNNKKKYSQKYIENYFSKSKNSPPPPGAVQKKLINYKEFENEKKMAEEQKQKRNGRKKTKKKRTKARNCSKKK